MSEKRLTDYPEAETLTDNDYVMVDNGGANGTKKFLAKNLGGGVTRELIGDYDINTSQSNLTTTKDMSQYDILEIEWIERGNRWEGGYWANEHIMFARYKTSDPKDPGDTSGLFYSDSTATSMAYTGDIGMAVRFIDETTLVNMVLSNTYIVRIWGIKY